LSPQPDSILKPPLLYAKIKVKLVSFNVLKAASMERDIFIKAKLPLVLDCGGIFYVCMHLFIYLFASNREYLSSYTRHTQCNTETYILHENKNMKQDGDVTSRVLNLGTIYIWVSGQLHAPATLSLRKEPRVLGGWVCPRAGQHAGIFNPVHVVVGGPDYREAFPSGFRAAGKQERTTYLRRYWNPRSQCSSCPRSAGFETLVLCI
jgi:hypothetical protein